jgi:hypothetical protein
MQRYDFHRLSVAPMMDWTDRHCRFFHRILTRHALLYTEMVTAKAGDPWRPRAPPRLRSGRAPRRPAARRRRSRGVGGGGADRRGLRLRRDQPQLRLPLGPRPGRPVRRLPHGGARPGGAGGDGDEGGRHGPGHGQVPHRHRRPGPGDGPRRVSPTRSSQPVPMRSSSMPARPGCRACRRARTARFRRSTTTRRVFRLKLSNVTRHTLGLFQAVPGARRFRRILAENAYKDGAGLEVWRAALAALKRGERGSAPQAAA